MTVIDLTIRGEVTSLKLEPDSTVIVSLKQPTSMDQIAAIKEQAQIIFPDHKVVVLDAGAELGAVEPTSTP